MINSQFHNTSSQNSIQVKQQQAKNIFYSQNTWEQKAHHFFKTTQSLIVENNQLQQENEKLKIDLLNAKEQQKALLRTIFGSKSEKEKKDENKEPGVPNKSPKKPKKKSNHGGGRKKFPKSLPSKHIKKKLDREKLEKEGYIIIRSLSPVTTEELEVKPIEIFLVYNERERLEVQKPNGDIVILTAGKTEQLIKRSQASNSVLATVCVYKFGYALSLFRIAKMFQEHQLKITRSALARWVIELSLILKPLIPFLERRMKNSGYTSIDETPIQVLREPGKNPQAKSMIWVRMTPVAKHPIILFFYAPNRKGSHAAFLLKGFTGFVQADGYSGYDAVTKNESFERLGCAMHARRKFVDAQKSAPDGVETLAQHAVEQFKELYLIEKEVKDLPPEVRFMLRIQKALPVWKKLLEWALEKIPLVRPKSKLATALTYFINQFPYLIAYLQNADLSIDNGAAERIIRPFAIGRKNWLFADTVAGAEATAILYSIISTIRANELPLFETLNKLFNLLSQDPSDIDYEAVADFITNQPPLQHNVH